VRVKYITNDSIKNLCPQKRERKQKREKNEKMKICEKCKKSALPVCEYPVVVVVVTTYSQSHRVESCLLLDFTKNESHSFLFY